MAGTAKSRKSVSYDRLAWADRFQKPTIATLRDALSANARHHFDNIYKRMLELENVREDLTWYGDCWKWSIEFRMHTSKPPQDPLVVLVPCPGDFQIALPLDKEFAQSLPLKRMKRAVRDGLELAQEPFDTRWGVWSIGAIGGANLLEDLQDLIEMKRKHLAKRAG